MSVIKTSAFVPLKATDSASDVADLFVQHVFRLHGLPSSIVSDRDPKFASHFWKSLTKLLGVDRSLASGCHPFRPRLLIGRSNK